VELGQILVVGVVFAVVSFTLRVLPRLDRVLAGSFCAAGLAGLGVYWFVERAYADVL
jgi:hypothetical protein